MLQGLALCAALACADCNGSLKQSLDDLAGKPNASSSVGTTGQDAADIPSGPELYCITNIAHTLEVY
ncbi:MAG TPA: hypothetical protein VL359_19935, partial [bacterium]|nr:hypothetical protein [bacterium]